MAHHVRRAAMTSPVGHITEAQPREVLCLTSARARQALSGYLRTPLRPGRTGPDAGMRGVTVRSTSWVPVIYPDGPGPPESAYPRKAKGDAGFPGASPPN